ncbi:MAG TPA: hypothetical protein VNJ08_08585 [Bacteriovoracaceae bacterium]|nr:hypothetical protein [Bacteriovoracaceae bacterium]
MKYLSLLTVATVMLASVSAKAVECSDTDGKYWIDEAEALIQPKGYRFINVKPSLFTLELAVVQNSFITAAYSRLYQEEKKYAPERAKGYLWLPGAAFASFEVGQVIRHAYYAVAESRGVKNSFQPKTYGTNPLHDVILGHQTITSEQVAINLIEGNKAVYRDLYWQHMAASECGVGTIIRVLADMKKSSSTALDRSHYGQLENGWKLIREGKFEEGNFALTRVEQRIVLQPLIYTGPLAKIFGRLFAKIAVTPIKDPNFSFPSFSEFCRSNGLTVNFSNFDSRWMWIVEQMKEMGRFFAAHSRTLNAKHNSFMADSRTVVGYLNDPSVRFLGVQAE